VEKRAPKNKTAPNLRNFSLDVSFARPADSLTCAEACCLLPFDALHKFQKVACRSKKVQGGRGDP
jgi:hypothetical protein